MYRGSILCLTALAGLGAASIGKAAVEVSGDPVLFWNEQLLASLSGSPIAITRGSAIVNIAIHDALNATMGSPARSWLQIPVSTAGDTRAAAAVAAHHALVSLYPANAPALNAALEASLKLIPDSPSKTEGILTGATVAAAVIANRTGDGAAAVSTYAPIGGAGHWVPTPPLGAAAAVPQYADVTPFLLSSPDQFRAEAPPSVESASYAAALNEVKEIGALGSLLRTPEQAAASMFWAPAPANGTPPWIRAAIDASLAKGLSPLENARLFAQLTVASADTGIAIWETKYHYDFWRPVTAIRNADLDNNPFTAMDARWEPYIVTPPHPSYLSAHSALAAAAATILDANLGSDIGFCLSIAGNDRCWNNFDAAAQDAADSRLWGGIHYRFDNEAGLALGAQVANFTLAQSTFGGAVPEPATWALMISGFGIVGYALRHRSFKVGFAA